MEMMDEKSAKVNFYWKNNRKSKSKDWRMGRCERSGAKWDRKGKTIRNNNGNQRRKYRLINDFRFVTNMSSIRYESECLVVAKKNMINML